MSSADGAAAAAAGAPVKAKRKRVRKQKTQAEVDAALDAQQAEEEEEVTAQVATSEPEERTPAKKKSKRDATQPPAPSAADNEDAPMPDADATDAAADPTRAEGEENDESSSSNNNGGGYLSQETLNYYKQLAAVLEANEFESDEERDIFLANVVEELCGGEAGKLRATTRRGAAGEAEDPTAQSTRNPAFVLQRLCSHAKCSHLVQKIMHIATPEQVGMFLTALQENVVDVLSDRYGSHVLESVLFRLPALLTAEANEANGGTSDEDKAAAAKAAAASTTRANQAWRNIGTHSLSSVADGGPDASRTPLRAHFFGLLTRIIPDGRFIQFAQHAHGAFALRHIIHILAGEMNIKAIADATSGSKHAVAAAAAPATATLAAGTAAAVPAHLAGLEELLPWITQEVIFTTASDELEETARSASGVPVLQALLQAIRKAARALTTGTDDIEAHPAHVQMRALCVKLVQFKGDDEDQWTPENVSQSSKNSVWLLFCDRSGSRLLETLCSLGGVGLVSSLFTCHMKGRLLELAQHQIGNFALQHVLQAVRASWGSRGRHLLRDAYDELTPVLADLCGQSRTGVVLQLLDACVRVQVKENRLFKLISGLAQEAFAEEDRTPVTSNVVGGLLLSPLLKSSLADKTAISVIGSLMVQSCLHPGRGLQADGAGGAPVTISPTTLPFATVLNAFLQLPQEFLLQLAMDQAGSHIFDAFVDAPCALNVKQQLLRRFQLKWVDLCMNQFGSFVLERLFTLAPTQLKVGIAGDLVRAEKRVLGSRSGATVHRKLKLEHFKRHQPSWLASKDATKTRAEALFKDVLDEGEEKKPAAVEKSDKKKADKSTSEKKEGKKPEGKKSDSKKPDDKPTDKPKSSKTKPAAAPIVD